MTSQAIDTSPGVGQRLRFPLSAPALITASVLWVAIAANQTLWSEVLARLSPLSFSSAGYSLTLLSLMVLLLSTPLLILGQRWLLKPMLITLLLTCGTLAYFTQELGVVFDIEMVRNTLEAIRDRNMQEGTELLSLSLISYLLITMAGPIVLMFFVRINYGSLWREQLRRLLWWGSLACITGTLVMVNFKSVTYFSRENKTLEVYLTPFYAMQSAKKLITRHRKTHTANFREIGLDAQQSRSNGRRTVGVMVVGETARRDHFALNGYQRNTNPELSARNIINFSNATSCGTSTAYSVPCMFSFMGQDTYTPESAGLQSNVLDVLETAGVKTIWVDSNSSCKGVCERIESLNIRNSGNTDSPLFVGGAWHDEKLLDYLDVYLESSESDLLLVLHTMGSHGPAYYRRYPDAFAKFKPDCQSKAPQNCTTEQIVNAYDNTIAYTDHVLASIIDKLESRNDSSFLIYASDHGESLGENGVYLHGLPRFIAPKAQTQVPIIAWFSNQYLSNNDIASQAHNVRQVNTAITHDNLSASLLGLYDVHTALYQAQLDLFLRDSVAFSKPALIRATANTVSSQHSKAPQADEVQ